VAGGIQVLEQNRISSLPVRNVSTGKCAGFIDTLDVLGYACNLDLFHVNVSLVVVAGLVAALGLLTLHTTTTSSSA
jgi:hypothetical protein